MLDPDIWVIEKMEVLAKGFSTRLVSKLNSYQITTLSGGATA